VTPPAQAGSADVVGRPLSADDDLVRAYRDRTPGSAASFEAARRVLPGGETRAVTTYPPYPVVIAEGHGARLTDVDGHGYLDLVNNYTAMVHGKIIGGGFPIGAVGGRADLLELTVASMTPGYVAHAGTFNGHLAAAVAGVMTLRHLDTTAISRLNDAAEALAERILAGAAAAGLPAEVTRAGSIMNVHLDGPSAPGQLADLHLALLLKGVYTTPRGMINLSTALSPADLDDVSAAYRRAFAVVRPAVDS
jgi:glutamate-1-semialdehyde 2,1-aminomutase